MKRLPYKEGTWFAVPLRTGGYAVGVAARVAPKGRILFAYFFGPRREEIPEIKELFSLTAEKSVLALMVGDLGLIDGTWKVIGQSINWERSEWPKPKFVRRESLTNRVYLVEYSDDDPSKRIRETRVDEQYSIGLPSDTLSGSGAAEIKLTYLLDLTLKQPEKVKYLTGHQFRIGDK